MSLTQEEKESLANRVVAILKASKPSARLEALERLVRADEDGDDSMNGAVLAIATTLLRRGNG